MAQFWRSFCLNRAQNQVILAAVSYVGQAQTTKNDPAIKALCSEVSLVLQAHWSTKHTTRKDQLKRPAWRSLH